MGSYTIDTAKAHERLEGVHFPREQAKVLVDLLAQSHEQVATKGDIQRLEAANKADIQMLQADIKADIQMLQADIKAVRKDIDGVEAANKADIQMLKADIEAIRKDFERLEASNRAEFEVVRKEIEQLDTKIDHQGESIKKDVQTEIARLNSKIISWIVGTGIAIVGSGRILDLFFGGG